MKINLSEIKDIVNGKILKNELMSRHTTFHIGGPCDLYVEVKDADELRSLVQYVNKKRIPYIIIGAGSNILVGDKGINGIVIRLVKNFCDVKYDIKNKIVSAGGGCSLPNFIKQCLDNGLGGMEFLAGIPGTVGGAVVMNAGTKDGNMASIIKTVTLMDEYGELKVYNKNSLKFSYRSSSISKNSIVISTDFMLKKMDKSNIIKKLDILKRNRAQTQPIGNKNAGCVFKNPAGDYASRLIDKAGLKGVSVGGAVVSTKHANYINNIGNASAGDVLKLIKKIQNKVKEKFNKKLELEIKVI
ncbi:MAG: UDP-N-acetylenolpyruvoylglucosamine reductase [Elusimicrobia bacterium RIFOXYD2_FULL_34_15]|nr:MAG: UDP-N-acetylenolpyruvoylglucosamine reductase [Elusimicrobia bacterium RIFOXYD2_FULL_34_15]